MCRVVQHLHHMVRDKKLQLKTGGALRLAGFDPTLAFTGTIDQFYPLGNGERVRRSVGADGKTSELLVKVPQDTLDTIITPTGKYTARQPIPALQLAAGVNVRFSSKHERRVLPSANNKPSTDPLSIVSVRLKERVSFVTHPKADFSIDCTRIRTGVADDDAKSQPPTFEVHLAGFFHVPWLRLAADRS